MTAVLTRPEDVINNALTRIGYAPTIGNIFEGTPAAKAAMQVYSQTLDDMLRDGEWAFCERNVVPTLLKSAPAGGYFPPTTWDPATNPPWPWLYSFTYPTDCLKVRILKPSPLFMQNMAPTPTLYSIVNDNSYTPPRRVIVCNIAEPILTYAAQVTDPTTWPPDFIEALSAALGRRLAAILMGPQSLQPAAVDEAVERQTAAKEQG